MNRQSATFSGAVPTTSKALWKQCSDVKGLPIGDTGKIHAAIEPELQVFRMIFYVLLHHEHQRRRRRRRFLPLRMNRRWRHTPVYRPLVDLASLEDRHIILTYRLDTATITKLCAQLEPDLISAIRQPTGIPPLVQVLSVLHILATGYFQVTVGLAAGMSQPMFSIVLTRVLSALIKHMCSYIAFPQVDDWATVKAEFYAVGHIPNIIGAIDSTHIAFDPPCQNEQMFRNRKSFHSMNVQMVCLADQHISHINA
ncbi:hypothetical protein NDU88_001923 [Pleurodeles waltl]|uniref:Nuclease HARBI1 n=1 Tax=Pleurodeles waltl TaxID=8319 RepID=A0AAV7P9C6_PLEWA|nr:hypothetical protein NDU88_001923 [Pleurodeles waltl]